MNEEDNNQKKEDKRISSQQKRTDHKIEEILPETMECPRCGSRAKRVTSKRGFHYKCRNKECGWDSNRIWDFQKRSRRRYIRQAINILKNMIPKLNFVENFSYNPDMVFTGEKKQKNINYDISVFFMGKKINRIRIELNQNLSKKQFMNSKYCYVVGRPKVVDYMAKRRGLVAHFLVDEQKQKIGVSRMDQVVKLCSKEQDNFGNLQYFIPKNLRPVLVSFDPVEIENEIFRGWHHHLYKQIYLR